MEIENNLPVGQKQVREFARVLDRYRQGKVMTERRILSSENWWRLRNTAERGASEDGTFKSVSGWLHNVIVSKHADGMDAYPEPVILPREEGDKPQAKLLSAIIPCILEQNRFEQVYSDVLWQKLKTGTGIYKVVWDARKLGGLGDVSISRVNLLDVYFEPGVNDIQKSRYVFHTERIDRAVLIESYPHLAGKLHDTSFRSTRFRSDDPTPEDDKVTVAEVYYRKQGRLHYCKFVGEELLYASENDPAMAERGFYDHGRYPYVVDALFPIEDSIYGYGFVDLCKNPQTEIDLLKTSFVKNAMVGASPRYFYRQDGAVNEKEFLDLSRPLVRVDGNLGQDSIRKIEHSSLDGVYVSVFDRVIDELRQTSGNTESATGNISAGVTAASAIAALQEASSKGSRDSAKASYRAYGEVVELCIELIRQFYTLPRRFRIAGDGFVSYESSGIRPRQTVAFGMELGMRQPIFDVKVSAQKQAGYSKLTQNELAVQFWNLGFFDPTRAEMALSCLAMMDFDGKDALMERISENATRYQRMTALQSAAVPATSDLPGLERAARTRADER